MYLKYMRFFLIKKKVTSHLFKPSMKNGASKCMGAVLLTQRGAKRLLKGLPYPNKEVYYNGSTANRNSNISGSGCYRFWGSYPDHFLNMVSRMVGDDFMGLWYVIPRIIEHFLLSNYRVFICLRECWEYCLFVWRKIYFVEQYIFLAMSNVQCACYTNTGLFQSLHQRWSWSQGKLIYGKTVSLQRSNLSRKSHLCKRNQ